MNPYVVAAWDIGSLHAASARFVEIAESTRNWVTRGEAVRAALAAPGAWDGVGSLAGLTDLAGWLGVTARSGPPLLALAEGIVEAVGWYGQAQQAAVGALRTAAASGVTVSAQGDVTPGPQADTTGMAPEQAAAVLDRAAAASTVLAELDRCREATARADALLRSDIGQFLALGVPGFDASSGFVDLALALNVAGNSVSRTLAVPVGADPEVVAFWWAGLSLDEQLRLINDSPELIGGLDGVSAWARDLANRAVLEELLRANPLDLFALSVAAALQVAAGSGQPVQLYLLDPEQELAGIAVGDLDTADGVAILVPGMNTTVTADMSAHVGDAVQLWEATQVVDPTSSVAVLAWIGYDTPNTAQAPFGLHAEWGAPALAATVAGVAARPGGGPKTTVIAHSYGTVVTGKAAQEPGPLGADAVVLVGSPGVEVWAGEFEVPAEEVYVGEADWDLIADAAWHGVDPSETWLYGGTCIEAGNQRLFGNGHTAYYEPTSAALWNMAYIVQGHRANVARC